MVNGRIRVKKMIYRVSNGKEIVFDAWEDNVNEYGTYWADICPECCKKFGNILDGKISDGASGEACCYICGCENRNAEAYVDFAADDVQFE